VPAAYIQANSCTANNLTALNATTGFTVAWWYRAMVYGTGGALYNGDVFHQHGSTNTLRQGYGVYYNANGNLIVGIYGSAGADATTFTGPSYIRKGVWHHTAVTFDDAANSIQYYVNGVEMGRAANTRDMVSTTSCVTRLAGSSQSVANFFGYLFDVQVFPNIVIRANEIPHLMKPNESLPGLKARYIGLRFSGAKQTTLPLEDESGNGNNLNVTNNTIVDYQKVVEPPWRQTLA